MRFLILFILFCGFSAHANWVSETDFIAKKADKNHVISTEQVRSNCSGKCIDVSGKGDFRRWEISGDILVPDNAGVLAADSEDSVKENEKQNKSTKEVSLKARMIVCAKAKGVSMTDALSKSCARDTAAWLMRSDLKAQDL